MKMKRFLITIVLSFACLILSAGIVHEFHSVVEAQTTPSIGLTFASTLSGCSAIGANTICIFGSATAPSAAVSIGGGTFVALNAPPPASGVTSFNTRTGAVVPATGDYSFSQISGTAAVSQLPTLNSLAGSITASQMPASQKCNLTFTLSAPVAGTSTNQLSGIAQLGGCQ